MRNSDPCIRIPSAIDNEEHEVHNVLRIHFVSSVSRKLQTQIPLFGPDPALLVRLVKEGKVKWSQLIVIYWRESRLEISEFDPIGPRMMTSRTWAKTVTNACGWREKLFLPAWG